ncbi:MAG TPA: 2OG-Fe(II) oxygenase [Acidimicrobiales bacterium]|nr:2OG-Fe(II) oxygenase [Acidimicrobiales bacterium]
MAEIGDVVSPTWLARAAELRSEFEAGTPFPLLVLDDFLTPRQAEAMLTEFPALDQMPSSRDYVFAEKRELSSIEAAGPACRRFYDAMVSELFAEFLSAATGRTVFVDPAFHGGGFHQSGDGSFLDMHVDFNIHPLHADWKRSLNILIYLCPEWDPGYGGELLVKARVEDEPRAIPMGFNRAVIMHTGDATFHGFRRMSLPSGVTRRSVATYAYEHLGAGERPAAHSTRWVPEEAGLGKRLLARHYETLVRLKQRVAGSGTARNR